MKQTNRRRTRLIGPALVALQLVAIFLAFWMRPAWLIDFFVWFQQLGPAAPALYVVIYIIATVLFLPGFLLTLGAGFLFGLTGGALVVSAGSTLGATASFAISRTWGRERIASELSHTPSYVAIDRAISHDGFKTVFLLRLSPLFPFNLLNYALGLTGVQPRRYVIATWIGMIPGTILYVYLGTLAATAAELLDRSSPRQSPLHIAMLVCGFIATLLVTALITRRARVELNKLNARAIDP